MCMTHHCCPISIGSHNQINHAAFDGCYYIATVQDECAVIKFDSCCKMAEKINTCRQYDCICYDWQENCFWASSKCHYDVLYKLDCNYTEIDAIQIKHAQQYGYITGISYRCCTNTLIVSFLFNISEVEKQDGIATPLYVSQFQAEWILGVLYLCGYFIAVTQERESYYLVVFDSHFSRIQQLCLGEDWTPQSLIFNPCIFFSKQPCLEILMRKLGCYSYLCYYAISPESCCCKCCNDFCHECCCQMPPHDSDSCTDILESIALVEASIAHILNAEGEKLQKVLEGSPSLDEILCVNQNINDTLIHATGLEQVLYAKLHALSNRNCSHKAFKN